MRYLRILAPYKQFRIKIELRCSSNPDLLIRWRTGLPVSVKSPCSWDSRTREVSSKRENNKQNHYTIVLRIMIDSLLYRNLTNYFSDLREKIISISAVHVTVYKSVGYIGYYLLLLLCYEKYYQKVCFNSLVPDVRVQGLCTGGRFYRSCESNTCWTVFDAHPCNRNGRNPIWYSGL